EGTAGALMTTEVAKLTEGLTVQQAIDSLARRSEDLETIYYLYVIDDDEQLRGVVSARQLIAFLARGGTPLQELMETDIVAAMVNEDQESVAEKVERYNLLAIPVVDSTRHLLGVITHDDVIDVVREELTEDIQQIAGVSPLEEEFLRINLFRLGWKRGIWLTILFFAAMLTAFVLKSYNTTIENITWLMWFLPLVLSSGGNSGSQSATLVITALTSGEVTPSDWLKIVGREIIVALQLGGFLAVLGFVVGQIIQLQGTAAIVVPLTLIAVVMGGCLCGATLPLLFKRLGLDPALMSNPFVAGLVDILGIVTYVTIAQLLLPAAG
ncbi:MAG: magnesium transporter, partial [Planctomycetota bacterium]